MLSQHPFRFIAFFTFCTLFIVLYGCKPERTRIIYPSLWEGYACSPLKDEDPGDEKQSLILKTRDNDDFLLFQYSNTFFGTSFPSYAALSTSQKSIIFPLLETPQNDFSFPIPLSELQDNTVPRLKVKFRNRIHRTYSPTLLQCARKHPFPYENTKLWEISSMNTLFLLPPVRIPTPFNIHFLGRADQSIRHHITLHTFKERPFGTLTQKKRFSYEYDPPQQPLPSDTLKMDISCKEPCNQPHTLSVSVDVHRTSFTSSIPIHRIHHHNKPSVLLVVFDTLRKDSLECKPSMKKQFPLIWKLCMTSYRYEHAYAHSGWTRDSIASLLTGLLPNQHGVLGFQHLLPENVPYLPELLQHNGYQTFAFITNGHLSKKKGFHRGFESFHLYVEDMKTKIYHFPAIQLAREVMRIFPAARNEHKPYFLYLHFTDPHWPYVDVNLFHFNTVTHAIQTRKRDAQAYAQWIRNLYEKDVVKSLEGFEMVLKMLYKKNLYHKTLIVVTSDHGESFYETNCWQHGQCLNSSVLHVPLWIKPPFSYKKIADSINVPVQHIDITPTILQIAHVSPPRSIMGKTLPPFAPEYSVRPVYIKQSLVDIILEGAIEYPYLFLKRIDKKTSKEAYFLFYIDNPERDFKNIAHLAPFRFISLLQKTQLYEELKIQQSAEYELTPEEIEKLKALGYLR